MATMLLACGAMAAPPAKPREPTTFTFKDWELRCDNTRTCRAAGYQSEADSGPVSLLLTRSAGPGTEIEMSLQVGADPAVKGPLRLTVGKAIVSGLVGDTPVLKPDQARAVLPELLRNEKAEVRAGSAAYTLSLAGVNAVLLRMDEAQGRVGTPGALVRRGTQPEASVLAPVTMPEVRNVLPAAPRAGDAALAKPIFAVLDLSEAKDQCNQGERIEAKSMEVHRLTAQKLLVALPCGMGAYNFTSMLWIANDKPPYSPRAVEANGDFDAREGSVTSGMKGRGLGDCWWSQTWHFTGSDFVLTREAGDGMCRGFPGGAWQLPSYVARIIAPPIKKP